MQLKLGDRKIEHIVLGVGGIALNQLSLKYINCFATVKSRLFNVLAYLFIFIYYLKIKVPTLNYLSYITSPLLMGFIVFNID